MLPPVREDSSRVLISRSSCMRVQQVQHEARTQSDMIPPGIPYARLIRVCCMVASSPIYVRPYTYSERGCKRRSNLHWHPHNRAMTVHDALQDSYPSILVGSCRFDFLERRCCVRPYRMHGHHRPKQQTPISEHSQSPVDQLPPLTLCWGWKAWPGVWHCMSGTADILLPFIL